MNSPDDTPTSELTENATAAFLFDEPNPVIEDAISGGTSESTDTTDGIETLAHQAAAAQTTVEPHTIITPEQEAEILATTTPTPAAQTTPIIDLVPIEPVVQTAPVTPAPAPSRAEIQRELNVYSVSEADYDAIFSTEDKQESMQALDAMLQKAVRQAVTMSHVLVQETKQQIQNQVQPYMQYADNQQQSVLESSFYSRHADLSGAKPVVDAVIEQFKKGGKKFSNHEQLFDAVATNTKAYLQQMQQLGQTVPRPTQGQVPKGLHSAKPRMAALPSGGQGGSGGVASGGKTNTAHSLFG